MTPSSRKYKAKDRVQMKNAVERFRVYSGQKASRAQLSALAYFTLPMTREGSDSK